jgi:ABC-2 type transport system permease protein
MNATLLGLPASPTLTMSRSRLLRAYAKEAKYEFLRMLRSPAFAIPTLLFPVLFYLLIGYIFNAFASKLPNAAIYIFTGFVTMAAITPGLFGFGIGFANEREQGVHTLKRALPMPPAAQLLGKMAMAMLCSLLALPPLLLAALTVGHVSLGIGQVLAMAVVVTIGAIPFCGLGLMIGSLASARSSPAIVNVIYIVLLYLSGLWFPLPQSFANVALASPAYHLHRLVLGAVGVPGATVGSTLTHVAILLALGVVFTGLAVRRFQRVG